MNEDSVQLAVSGVLLIVSRPDPGGSLRYHEVQKVPH